MPAVPGAVSSVEAAAVETQATGFTLRVIGDGVPVGICGTGLVDTVAFMLERGIIDKTGRFLGFDEIPAEFEPFIGKELGASVFYLTEDHSLYVTQDDIRNLQLAKAAIHAGIRVLLDKRGLQADDIDSLLVAGGFGQALTIRSAATIGLFPRSLARRACSVGNTAIEGASVALFSAAARDELISIAARCDHIELSMTPEFNGYYMNSLYFEEGEGSRPVSLPSPVCAANRAMEGSQR
jgi:uncharacterized 2Fe-2S/4Fe-4S cluster protein (DUF4445 family)